MCLERMTSMTLRPPGGADCSQPHRAYQAHLSVDGNLQTIQQGSFHFQDIHIT